MKTVSYETSQLKSKCSIVFVKEDVTAPDVKNIS